MPPSDIQSSQGTIYIVDDDPSMRKALRRLLKAAGFEVATFESAQRYLEFKTENAGVAGVDPGPECILLDVHLPGLDGLGLQEQLTEDRSVRPIVFLTGRGDVPMSVQAMRGGAVDFLLKPVDEHDLLDAINRALAIGYEKQKSEANEDTLTVRLARLTNRERQVLKEMLTGAPNKQIADRLGIAERTVKMHRSRVMHKLEANTMIDLAPYIAHDLA